jgi:hypothetical protein
MLDGTNLGYKLIANNPITVAIINEDDKNALPNFLPFNAIG